MIHAPDLMVVFRGNVPHEQQEHILDALKGRLTEGYRSANETIKVLDMGPETQTTLDHFQRKVPNYGGNRITTNQASGLPLIFCPETGGVFCAQRIVFVDAPDFATREAA